MEILEELLENSSGVILTFVLGWIWWRLCHTVDLESDRLDGEIQPFARVGEDDDQVGSGVDDSGGALTGGCDGFDIFC